VCSFRNLKWPTIGCSDNADGFGLGFGTLEGDSVVAGIFLHAVQPGKKIEVPELPPKLAIGGVAKADLSLLRDYPLNGTILDGL
jgi:hypothetical protein